MTQIFTAAGIGMMVCSFLIWKKHKGNEKRRRCRVTGVVTENVKCRMDVGLERRPPAWFPVVKYTCLDGKQVVARCHYGTGAVQYDTGTKVNVWYDPNDPEDFHLDNHGSFNVGMTVILSILSVSFVVIGLLFGYYVMTGKIS